MVSLGADFAYARPGGAALVAAGVTAVGRYLAMDSRGITSAEYQDYVAHGVHVWLVREGAATGMLGGAAQGVADAQLALSQIAVQGLPLGSPAYWAADFDIAPGSASVAAAEAYVDGWNSVIPAGRRGGYGGLWFLNYIHGKGKVDFLWECASTSFRHGVDPASVPLHIQQTTDTPPLPGTDHNNIFDMSSFAGLSASPIIQKAGFDMPQNWNNNGQIVTVGETFAILWTNPNSFAYQTHMAAWGDPVQKSLTPDELTTIVNDCNARGARYSQVGTVAQQLDQGALAAAVAAAIVKAAPSAAGLTLTDVQNASLGALKTFFAAASK